MRHPPNQSAAVHPVNHYERLKVTQDAPPEVIRAAYRALANRLHPDRSGAGEAGDAHEQMVALNAAYEVLIDPALRRDYDASLSTVLDWRAAVSDDALDLGGDPSTGVVHADLAAPVTAWAPDMKHVLLTGVAILALLTVGFAWYLKADPTGSTIDGAMGERLVRHEDSVAVEAARRGEMPDLNQSSLESGVRRPSVEELARMSDEELVAAMPALDGQAARLPAQARRAVSAASATRGHPLDGPGLSLKVDAELLGSYTGRTQAGSKP